MIDDSTAHIGRDVVDELARQAAEAWRPITEATGYSDGHPAADPAFQYELIAINLELLGVRLRKDLAAQMAALPWPVRAWLRISARIRW
jgi:hypothetical protein